MNGKIIGGVLGIFLTLFVLALSLTVVMPMLSDIMADTNISDFTGLKTVLGASLAIVVLGGIGGSVMALYSGIQTKRGRGRA